MEDVIGDLIVGERRCGIDPSNDVLQIAQRQTITADIDDAPRRRGDDESLGRVIAFTGVAAIDHPVWTDGKVRQSSALGARRKVVMRHHRAAQAEGAKLRRAQFGDRQTTADVLVLTMPGVPEPESCRVAAELRAAGVATEIYLGPAAGKVGRQLSWANARQMGVAVLLGEAELADGTVTVKDLGAGARARAGIAGHDAYVDAGAAGQRVVQREELVQTVRGLLAGHDVS